jgi:glycosyltransferase involved in cell wall biosynthesis
MGSVENQQIAVLIPSYFGSTMLPLVLESLARQSKQEFVVYINDNTPESELSERVRVQNIVDTFGKKMRISYRVNERNLGYPKNLIRLVERTDEEFIYVVAQDDILSEVAVELSMQALRENPNCAVVCRPYYWFDSDQNRPIREISVLNSTRFSVINAQSSWADINHVLVSASQVSGLMYRRSQLREAFVDSIFPAHIYPVAGALRDGGVVFLPLHTVAVRVAESQTRNISTIYEESPCMAWINLYEQVFSGSEFSWIRNSGIQLHMGKNFVGLIQIRAFGRYRYFLREARIMLSIRHSNFIDPRFWITLLSLSVLPRSLIVWLTDTYKSLFLSKSLKSIRLASKEDLWW